MFKVNNKNIRATSLTSSVSIVNFEQVNFRWIVKHFAFLWHFFLFWIWFMIFQQANRPNYVGPIISTLTWYLPCVLVANPFIAIDHFLYPLKHRKHFRDYRKNFRSLIYSMPISGFLMFSGGVERNQWHEMC